MYDIPAWRLRIQSLKKKTNTHQTLAEFNFFFKVNMYLFFLLLKPEIAINMSMSCLLLTVFISRETSRNIRYPYRCFKNVKIHHCDDKTNSDLYYKDEQKMSPRFLQKRGQKISNNYITNIKYCEFFIIYFQRRNTNWQCLMKWEERGTAYHSKYPQTNRSKVPVESEEGNHGRFYF